MLFSSSFELCFVLLIVALLLFSVFLASVLLCHFCSPSVEITLYVPLLIFVHGRVVCYIGGGPAFFSSVLIFGGFLWNTIVCCFSWLLFWLDSCFFYLFVHDYLIVVKVLYGFMNLFVCLVLIVFMCFQCLINCHRGIFVFC